MDGMLFSHSIQMVFKLFLIVEIDEWDIDLILIQLKRAMNFQKM
jgi:hypothetical protein